MSSKQITDPEVLDFIARSVSFFPPDTSKRPVLEQRSCYDRMAAAFREPRDPAVAVDQWGINGPDGIIMIRRYWTAVSEESRVLYFHGGGFVMGGLESHDDICSEIALYCRTEVISIDYRLCPEHRHPAAFDDCLAAFDVFADRPVVLVGDSAGGNLAAAVAQTRRKAVKGQVLIYPGLGGDLLGLAAYRERAYAPMLTTDEVKALTKLRIGGGNREDDPTCAPLLSEDLRGVPPCFISAAEHDPLRDDGAEYVMRLADAGVLAEFCVEPELPHGHLRARAVSQRANEAFERILGAIRKMLGESDR